MENTTVLEIAKLGLGIDSDLDIELLAAVSGDFGLLTNLEVATVDFNVEGLLASEA